MHFRRITMALSDYFALSEGGDHAFTVEAPKIKFGVGSLREIGDDARALGMTRVALYTDPRVAEMESVATAKQALEKAGIGVEIYAQVEVERSEAHTSELQSLMRISYAVFCLTKKNYKTK